LYCLITVVSAALADATVRCIYAKNMLAGLLLLGTAAAVAVTRARACMPDLLDRFGVLLLGCLECLLLGEGGEEGDFFRHLLY